MCTAITYKTCNSYFGRNLDLEYCYNETVTVTPRNYPLRFRHNQVLSSHYAIIGMAYVVNGYPLYYDAINEMGVGIAGLSFGGNAEYTSIKNGRDNIAPYELIPWILGTSRDILDARVLTEQLAIIDENFSNELPNTPLHWMICDKTGSIVLEQTSDGIKVFDNPVGVLTNNPTFDYQLFMLNNYMNITANEAENRFIKGCRLVNYSNGLGAIGLPGDVSSMSRFVRGAFVKQNSVSGLSEKESVSQFFHILSSVEQPRGSVRLKGDKYEITVYSSCCNLDKGIYYCKTYENHQIMAVEMYKENLEREELISYPLIKDEQIRYIN